jgi:hypothetical protein
MTRFAAGALLVLVVCALVQSTSCTAQYVLGEGDSPADRDAADGLAEQPDATGGSSGSDAGIEDGTVGSELFVESQAQGAPRWSPAGFQQFSAPMGSKSDSLKYAQATILSALGYPKHVYDPIAQIMAPGTPHAPHEQEVAESVMAAGWTSTGTLPALDFAAPGGLFLIFLLFPNANAPIGATPDYASGKVLPDSLFPISIDADALYGNVIFYTALDSKYPALGSIQPDSGLAGYSHIPLVFALNSDNVIPATGFYRWRIRVIDATGSGWTIVVHFRLL